MTDLTSTTSPTPTDQGRSRHPDVETWIAYHAGTVSSDEHKRMQRHLASCRSCLDLVLDLDRFAEPTGDTDGNVSDFERAAVWRSMQPYLDTESRTWATAPRSTWLALAASVVFATSGLSLWSVQQREMTSLNARVAELSRPHANAIILDLTPSSRQRSAQGAEVKTSLPKDAGPITLILNLAEPTDYAAYRLEILDQAGHEVQRIDTLKMRDVGNFTLTLPVGSLTSGDYELQLFGIDADNPATGDAPAVETLLETYPISLR